MQGRTSDFRKDSLQVVNELYCRIYIGKDKRGYKMYRDPYKSLREKARRMIKEAKTDNEIIRVLHTIREEA